MAMDVDIRDVLPAVRVPTLIIHGPGNAGQAQYMAERMPAARRLELPNGDESIWLVDEVPEQTRRFAGDVWLEPEPETVLATILFTDIVGSTECATALGDRQWNALLGRHHALLRRQLDQYHGRELDTAGDGFFASFDGPVRAIRCARAISECVRELGLEVRVGLHTGECEVREGKVSGIAVNIAARVMANAGAGEVLVSSTVKDLVAGSPLVFEERGAKVLKGIGGEWQLFSVASEEGAPLLAAVRD
jgi:class 3 adenylate cyclase